MDLLITRIPKELALIICSYAQDMFRFWVEQSESWPLSYSFVPALESSTRRGVLEKVWIDIPFDVVILATSMRETEVIHWEFTDGIRYPALFLDELTQRYSHPNHSRCGECCVEAPTLVDPSIHAYTCLLPYVCQDRNNSAGFWDIRHEETVCYFFAMNEKPLRLRNGDPLARTSLVAAFLGRRIVYESSTSLVTREQFSSF